MAGAMRKVAVYLGLVEDRDRYDDYEDDYDGYDDTAGYDDPDDPEEPAFDDTSVERLPEPRRREGGEGATVARLSDRRQATRRAGFREARITTLHPRTYNEARTLGEHFRDGTPVIMDLSDMDDVDAKRLVDFAAGLIFGLHGSIDRVTAKVFLLTPADVRVNAEDKVRMASGGFFNQS